MLLPEFAKSVYNRARAAPRRHRHDSHPPPAQAPPVSYKGVDYQIGQANNALIYPGIGLETIVSQATHVTDGMPLAASQAIAALVDVSRPGAGLLPEVENLRAVSHRPRSRSPDKRRRTASRRRTCQIRCRPCRTRSGKPSTRAWR